MADDKRRKPTFDEIVRSYVAREPIDGARITGYTASMLTDDVIIVVVRYDDGSDAEYSYSREEEA